MAVAIFSAAFLVPVSQGSVRKSQRIEKPGSVAQVEEWVEKLKQDEAVDEKSLAAVEAKIEELLQRPQDQWYQHASLEAADHLRDEMGKSLQELGSQLEQSRSSLASLAEAGQNADAEMQKALAKQASEDMNGLRSGAMKAGGDLAEQLKNMDPQALKNMSPEQMKQLAERHFHIAALWLAHMRSIEPRSTAPALSPSIRWASFSTPLKCSRRHRWWRARWRCRELSCSRR
jgi:hypothetical protein